MAAESVASLLARLKEAHEALQPFADFAHGFESRSDSYVIASTMLGRLSVGDLRRAQESVVESTYLPQEDRHG